MGVAAFGPGIAIITRTDITPSAPVNAGYCQNLELTLKGTTKDLFGQNQFPLVSARGTIKASGKITPAVDSGIVGNAMFFGSTISSGGFKWNINEGPDAIPTTPYQVTVTNAATFDQDLGVVNAATLVPFAKVTSAPAAGQYSVAAGVYTFSSADNVSGISVLITYTSTVTTGEKMILANQLIGTTPTFQLDYWTQLAQPSVKSLGYRLYACISDSIAWGYKLEDFGMPQIEFSFFANSAGNIMEKVWSEAS
jgi:hypothetical protein